MILCDRAEFLQNTYLTPKDIQEHLQIGRDKAYALCALKGFPAIKIGSSYRVDPIKYNDWLDKQSGTHIYI